MVVWDKDKPRSSIISTKSRKLRLYRSSGIQTILRIEKAGTPYHISVPFFKKEKMQLLNDIIHNALAEDTDKTDLNLFFGKKSQ
ncbi:hypothetical protein [Bacillus mycoides]|uniref:hypothetical protein n=1 Tax=Bacillus mycoides TaxID=1405 RepID=UPI0013FDA76E|nr:hypothetical protein [Bacillus mycoides]